MIITKEAQELLKTLKSVEWVINNDFGDDPVCPICFSDETEGHNPDCLLKKQIDFVESLLEKEND